MLIRLLSCLILTALALPAQSVCSIQNLAGTYAFYSEGNTYMTPEGATQPALVPFAEVGLAYIKGDGTATGWATASMGGQPTDLEIVDGKVQIGANCAGKFRSKLRVKGTNIILPQEVIRFLAADNSAPLTLHSTMLQGPMPNTSTVDTSRWVRISYQDSPQAICSARLLNGTFVVDGMATVFTTMEDKSVVPVPMTWTMMGSLKDGAWTAAENAAAMRSIVPIPPMAMGQTSLDLDPTCTGVFKFKFNDYATGAPLPGQGIERFVVIPSGDDVIVKAVYLQGILGKPTGLETWTRISPN
jgi:hypothetical protein